MKLKFKKYLLCLAVVIFTAIITYSCSKSITYRKPVQGIVKNHDEKPLSGVHVYYDSLDILSPRNIFSKNNGHFKMPKIEIEDTQESKRKIQKLSPFIYFKKDGYETKKYELSKADNSDTIRLGVINLEII